MPVEHSVTPEQASSSTAVGYDLSESAMLKGERAELRAAHDARRACGEADVWKGVALSGGGIRSATFSLGALQALAAHGILPRMDYMSTVSGGGYIGSALQWWWSEARFNEAELEFKTAKEKAERERQRGKQAKDVASAELREPRRFGATAADFPYGCGHLSQKGSTDNAVQKDNLAFLRNHGNYLIPGDGITAWSGLYVVLRTLLISLVVWLPLMFALFLLLQLMDAGLTWLVKPALPSLKGTFEFANSFFKWTCEVQKMPKASCQYAVRALYALALAIYAFTVVVFILISLVFALLTRIPSEVDPKRKLTLWDITVAIAGLALIVGPFVYYKLDKLAEPDVMLVVVPSITAGLVMVMRFLFGFFFRKKVVNGSYWWRRKLETWFGSIFYTGLAVLVAGSLPLLPFYVAEYKATAGAPAAVISALFAILSGTASALYGYYSLARKLSPGLAARIFLPLGAAIFLYGTLTLAYVAAVQVYPVLFGGDRQPSEAVRKLIYCIAPLLTLLAVYLAFRTNVNQVGLHRFYRDRLMEAFMPSLAAVTKGRSDYSPVADRLNLLDLRSSYKPLKSFAPVPYPLINTFARIVRDDDAKVASRGGDNFVLSPHYVGCNSTLWESSESYAKRYGPLTLATAMAASGAAVNSNAGYIGTGITRDRLISAVMTILNMRLGIWVGNPARKGTMRRTPVYMTPTLTSGLLGYGRAHTSAFIEISDGGNFDNLGLYELVRRKVGLIIMVDGEADATIALPALVSAAVRIKEDFKATLSFEAGHGVDRLVPAEKASGYPAGAHFAAAPYVVGQIDYEAEPGKPVPDPSVVIYVKATLVHGLDFTTTGYRAGNPDFPHQTTLDQFFDPVQFEAYRDLGYRSTERMIGELGLNITSRLPDRESILEKYRSCCTG